MVLAASVLAAPSAAHAATAPQAVAAVRTAPSAPGRPGASAAPGVPGAPAAPGKARVIVPPVQLGEAADCAVLAGAAVTNTNMSLVTGDVNVTPGDTVSGFPPGAVRGSIDVDNAEARREKAAAVAAYHEAASRTPTATIPPNLGGNAVLTAGVYNTPGGVFTLSGTLKLDAQGDPGAVFIFQATTLVTERVSNIDLLNGAQADNVFWEVRDSATLGKLSTFRGNLMAYKSVTVQAGTAMFGRAMGINSAVQLIGTTDGPPTHVTVPDNPPTSTTLSSSPNPSHTNQPVTFTATVLGSDQGFRPTGTVLFKDGSAVIGSAMLNTSAVATFTTSSLPLGARQMTATYVPNGTAVYEKWVYFAPSVSPVLVQQVQS